MIEKLPVANLIGHLVLILGITIVAFPIYYTFVDSSMTFCPRARLRVIFLNGSRP